MTVAVYKIINMHIPNKDNCPQISVCMPVYNRSTYLRECIDSILAQTFVDFELLIVDDGSTDSCRDIIRSYSDSRIRLIENEHNFIASLNMLLDEAKGKYIARMDSDDIMIKDRLESQYEYMEAHPEIDVLGGGIEVLGLHDYPIYYPVENVTLQDMIDGCCIVHPTAMIKRNALSRYHFRYKPEFIYAEDYGLWCEMLRYGMNLKNLRKPLIKYRVSENQVTVTKSDIQLKTADRICVESIKWLLEKEKKVFETQAFIKETDNKLTLVIPFLNEREEVVNTVRSARETAGYTFDIIVINDCSDNDYNYEIELSRYDVNYVYNSYRIGAAASKEKGVSLIKTPYFLLLDAHMRFYNLNWVDVIINYLRNDDHQLLCCQTKILEKKDGVVFESQSAETYGAFLSFRHDEYIPGIHWNMSRSDILESGQIACILGAGYAASKRYWDYIKGLQGLLHYGCEEAYLSIKSWLFGGGCRLLPEVEIGHIYKDKFVYKVYTSLMRYNNLFIAETLFPTSLRCLTKAVAYKQDEALYFKIYKWMEGNSEKINELRRYYVSISQRKFEFILKINNSLSPQVLEELKKELNRLPDFFHFIEKETVHQDFGLISGMMGQIIAYCLYAERFPNEQWDNAASFLFEEICAALNKELPVTFGRGICGIGWAIIYLQNHHLLADDMKEELQLIDELLMERSPLKIKDLSFTSGIGGILCYVTTRLRCIEKDVGSSFFDETYLNELENASRKLLNAKIDYRSRNFAMQFIEYMHHHKDKHDIFVPEFEEIVDLPTFAPKMSEYWKTGLYNLTGYVIRILLVFRKDRDLYS